MSKLEDWDDVPTEYKWRAFDEDGERFYFSHEPVALSCSWSPEDGLGLFGGQDDRHFIADWHQTLEERPATTA